jgi:predicted ATPase
MIALMYSQFIVEVKLKRSKVPSFDAYPFSLPIVRSLDALSLHPSVTFFVGENGAGKSTLLEAIAVACGFNAEGGGRNFGFSTQASHSELHKYLRISRGVRKPRTGWFFRAESYYNVATDMDRRDEGWSFDPPIRTYYGGSSLHRQSHGESFMSLLMHRFSASGLYILDEPEAALSPTRQIAALVRIHQLVQGGAQFIIATHSPILMAYPHATLLALGDHGMTHVDYVDTEHFRTTRNFLNNHASILEQLIVNALPDKDR